jgi:hypothetical protein
VIARDSGVVIAALSPWHEIHRHSAGHAAAIAHLSVD